MDGLFHVRGRFDRRLVSAVPYMRMSFDAFTLLIFLAGILAGVGITLDILATVDFVRIIQFKVRQRKLRGGN